MYSDTIPVYLAKVLQYYTCVSSFLTIKPDNHALTHGSATISGQIHRVWKWLPQPSSTERSAATLCCRVC